MLLNSRQQFWVLTQNTHHMFSEVGSNLVDCSSIHTLMCRLREIIQEEKHGR